MTENGEDQCEAQSRFSGGYRDCKQSEQRPVHQLGIGTEVPERDEIEVGRVQHDFQADQHDDDVPARKRSHQTNREENGGEDQEMVKSEFQMSC